jgi:hypothetical protein
VFDGFETVVGVAGDFGGQATVKVELDDPVLVGELAAGVMYGAAKGYKSASDLLVLCEGPFDEGCGESADEGHVSGGEQAALGLGFI